MDVVTTTGGFILEISAKWGIRIILKVISGKLLHRIRRRVEIEYPAEGHHFHRRAMGRPLEFVAYISNPTPLDICICEKEIKIINSGVVLAVEKDYTSIQIPREGQKRSITLAIYRPLLYPIGLPARNERWELEGVLRLSCYYGEWELPIKTGEFSIGADWDEAKQHIKETLILLRDGIQTLRRQRGL